MSAHAARDDLLRQAYTRARRHLGRRDPVMKRVMRLVGPCTLRPDGDGFRSLVRAIVAQLISTAAARTVFGRLEEQLGAVTPAAVLAAGPQRLRSVGLSATKARALGDLASRVESGLLPLDRMDEMDSDEILACLLPVHGIGRWTAEMFLIFSLGRFDVLPVDDFGLRAGVRDHYGLAELPDRARLRVLAEAWRPYRTVATWYLWRSRGFVPQSR
jgi:DNA-3-methyladenine glycosylase II